MRRCLSKWSRARGSAAAGHFLIVERVEVNKWPYDDAWGHYHWHGRPAEGAKIRAAGTYNWKAVG